MGWPELAGKFLPVYFYFQLIKKYKWNAALFFLVFLKNDQKQLRAHQIAKVAAKILA